MHTADPLAITRGLALTDAGLAYAGLSREQRLEIWRGSLDAMAAQEEALGLGGWLIPGAVLEVETLREGPVLAELGWPEIAAGPEQMRLPLRRFGSMAWDMDGGSWAPGWWSRVRRRASPVEWDRREDGRRVADEIAHGFSQVWQRNGWLALSWRQATPGWVDRIFCQNHAAMKQGVLDAMTGPNRSTDAVYLPVLADGVDLVKATVKNLADPKTTLFSPSEAGFRAFLENVRSQNVPQNLALSMGFTWWRRASGDEVLP